ncbi:MAG: hypothetical protein KDI36_18425 [Pseudomonadales bacterium]|nr:hypothetical protein [Pseudomonadales bacterium]
MKGAGGTSGGTGQFLLGLVMMAGGFYLLLNAIRVTSRFGFGMHLYGFQMNGAMYNITTGMVVIPFIFGIGMIFYNSRNLFGWLLAGGSLTALIFGVIASIEFSFRMMSAFDLILILVLAFGGLGLFLRSLRDMPEEIS